MIFNKLKNKDEASKGSPEYRIRKRHSRNFIIFYLKRIFHYLTILHGIMTIIFLIAFFQGDISQRIVDFYLYFSLIIFITYGFLIFGINLLQKSEMDTITSEPTRLIKPLPKAKPEISEDLLQGKVFQVYWYFFTHGHAGVREIQKALNFSSTGTVAYQINKLLKAGIISKIDEEGKYSLNKELKIGILKLFIRIGNRVIPRISLYLIIYILGFIVYAILALVHGYKFIRDPVSLILLFFLIFGAILFIFESFKIQKLKPTS